MISEKASSLIVVFLMTFYRKNKYTYYRLGFYEYKVSLICNILSISVRLDLVRPKEREKYPMKIKITPKIETLTFLFFSLILLKVWMVSSWSFFSSTSFSLLLLFSKLAAFDSFRLTSINSLPLLSFRLSSSKEFPSS